MIDLNDHIERRKLVAMIEADVDRFSREELQDDPRKHLGASVVGHPCTAKSWNAFRWLKEGQAGGQLLRLFERGHLEEPRMVRWLRGIGFEVRDYAERLCWDVEGDTYTTLSWDLALLPYLQRDVSNDATHVARAKFQGVERKQFRVIGCNGHFGGSLDGLAKAPDRYALPEPMLVEFKTHNENSYTKLAGSKSRSTGRRENGEGVKISKPQHYKQMCAYGRAYGFHFGLYVAVNKNTDELHFEIVPLDWTVADDTYRKADGIIRSQEQPPKIAQVETYFECKYCDFAGICFRGELPDKNCRSCKHARPIENGAWVCTEPKINLRRDFYEPMTSEQIAKGCDSWQPIINGKPQ